MKSNSIISSRARSLKLAITALIFASLFTSCVTQRACLEKYPPVTTIQKDSIVIYKDKVVLVPMPADTVRDSITVALPCPVPATFKTRPVYANGKYATAKAWLQGDKLKIILTMNDTSIAAKIDSAIVEYKKTVTITQGHILKEKYIPNFYKIMLFISILAVVSIVGKFVISLKR